MRRRHAVLALLLPAVTAAWAPTVEAATCAPDGTALSITAFDGKFDKKCLAVAAGAAFTIDFSNLDRGIPHNVAIYEDETAGRAFFKGELIDGPGKTTYSVEPLAEGTFFFRCDPHPDMNGSFIVAPGADAQARMSGSSVR